MIAQQLNIHPHNTSVVRNTLLQTYSATSQQQIRIVETPADRFFTEIVADALKIAATGQRVLIVQLLKGGIRQGHDRVVNLAQNLDWIRCNLARNISTSDLNQVELDNFQLLWNHVRSTTKSPSGDAKAASQYSLLILDDLSLAIELGLISLESALDFFATLPKDMVVVLTGTNPHPAILELAAA
jgi:cob(I)alamin adenosyltransferase